MKRFISILALIAIAATGAFAQASLSMGGGVFTDISSGNGYKYTNTEGKSNLTDSVGTQNISLGGYVFFDATYVEASASFAVGMLSAFEKISGEADYSGKTYKINGKEIDRYANVQQLGFTVLGKYPVELGAVTLFPLIGASYNMVLGGTVYIDGEKIETLMKDEKDKDGNAWKISRLNQFGILAGGGLDYDINSNLYLRCQVMLQVRLVDKDVSDFVEEAKKHVDKNETVSTSLGIGPVFKVGIGFRF